MKKTLTLIALTVAVAVPSYGISYNDYDLFGSSGLDGILITGGSSHVGEFDIVNSDGGLFDNVGFNPAGEVIVSAKARFGVGTIGFGDRYYDIDIGAEDFASGSFFAVIIGGATEDGDVTGSALISLSSTGAVNYTIANNTAPGRRDPKLFSLLWAKLDVETERKAGGNTGVPDSGSTLALLGLGLVGVFFARRRAAK